MSIKKLNIGCGQHPLKGYDNCDRVSMVKNVIATNIMTLSKFQNNSYDEVFSRMVIEHLKIEHIPTALHQLFRVLKEGGKLILITVDFEGVIGFYNSQVKGRLDRTKGLKAFEELCHHLMGAELDENIIWHQSVLTFDYLKILLASEGFVKIIKEKAEDKLTLKISCAKRSGRPFAVRGEL